MTQLRKFKTIRISTADNLFLTFLYRCLPGRLLLRFLIHPAVSAAAGLMLNTRLSRLLIPFFIQRNHIRMDRFEQQDYQSFNDFFTRKLKHRHRMLPDDPTLFCAPCDGKLTAYPIADDLCVSVKGTPYTLERLLRDRHTAQLFAGGTCLIFRLTPDDYHRYSYPDSGRVLCLRHIPGVLHTVRPIAMKHYNVFHENSRQWTLIRTEQFGTILQMEVGALFVGKIKNHRHNGPVLRGAEKGRFEMGGSTIILLLRRNCVTINPAILNNTKNELETIVRYGNVIGRRTNDSKE